MPRTRSPADRASRTAPPDWRGPRQSRSRRARTRCWLPPSTQSASFTRGGFHQLVEADDDSQGQAGEQEPGRRATPVVDRIPEPAEQDDAPDQRVTGRDQRSRSRDVFLQRLGGLAERRVPIVVCHYTARPACLRTAHQYTLAL